nr:MAG TPA: hypothetical protein [Caudoviricetes sp.]
MFNLHCTVMFFLLLSSDRQQLLKPPMSPCKSKIRM